MSEAALIEELARIINPYANWDRKSGDDAAFEANRCVALQRAQAILPIIRAREIAVGERVRDAAAEACLDYMFDCLDDRDVQRAWPRTFNHNKTYAGLIRALDIPSILKDEA